MENDNLDLTSGQQQPQYFYRVSEFVTTFQKDQKFSNQRDFKDKNLIRAKNDATSYYQERLNGFNNGDAKFFHPFASPANFQFGENSAYSITLALVEYYSEADQFENIIEGESEDILMDGRETEKDVLKFLGYIK